MGTTGDADGDYVYPPWPQPVPWPARRRRIHLLLLGLVVAVLLLEAALSMAWPRTFPRASFLPKPPREEWHADCNDHARWWERDGLFWRSAGMSTTAQCLDPPP